MLRLTLFIFLLGLSDLGAFSLPFFSPAVDKHAQGFLNQYTNVLPEEEKRKGREYVKVYKEAYSLFVENYLYKITDAKQQELAKKATEALNKYVESAQKENTPIQAKDLMESVMGEIFNSIDAHTVWMSAEKARDFSSSLTGNYKGIGILFNADSVNKNIKVIKVFNGGPAFKAGLMKGDVIIAVDDKKLSSLESINDVPTLIRGIDGTEVIITALRAGKEHTFKVTRGSYYVPSLEYYIVDNKYGIITIHSFNNDTAALFRSAIDVMKVNDLQGLIIDVRNNPGGLLTAVVLIGDNILSGENIVAIKGRSKAQDKTFVSVSQTQIRHNLPIVVLINSMSASASELLAGSLALNNRATVIGNSTFGKWSVQSSFSLTDGSIFNITTQLFYAPRNTTFQGDGIAPDIEITSSPPVTYFREKDYPNALQVPEANSIKRVPRLSVKDTSCPLVENEHVDAKDYILGCAVLYLNSSSDISAFKSSLR